mmetsp:Transcript_69079/g.174145  ORF Transcript_69079/g.174145 Transcript_69079/m.174145 type:complete len:108 (-) Transcript_69079:109-432(-)
MFCGRLCKATSARDDAAHESAQAPPVAPCRCCKGKSSQLVRPKSQTCLAAPESGTMNSDGLVGAGETAFPFFVLCCSLTVSVNRAGSRGHASICVAGRGVHWQASEV